MAPVNRCKNNRLLKSLQDGLSNYFQSRETPRSFKSNSASRRQNRNKFNLNTMKNIVSNKNVRKKVISLKSNAYLKSKRTNSNEIISKIPDEIKLLNDGLTNLYKVSDSKRLSLYRCIANDDSQEEVKRCDRKINKRTSNVSKSNQIIEDENPLSKIRRSQVMRIKIDVLFFIIKFFQINEEN